MDKIKGIATILTTYVVLSLFISFVWQMSFITTIIALTILCTVYGSIWLLVWGIGKAFE